MKNLYKLKESLMDSLDELDTIKGGKLKMGELEALNFITDTIKNIDKICMLEGGEYSQRDGSYRGGRVYSRDSGNYGDNGMGGNSYANRGEHWVKGHYSRDGGITEMIYSAIEQVENPKVKEHLEKALREVERQ